MRLGWSPWFKGGTGKKRVKTRRNRETGERRGAPQRNFDQHQEIQDGNIRRDNAEAQFRLLKYQLSV